MSKQARQPGVPDSFTFPVDDFCPCMDDHCTCAQKAKEPANLIASPCQTCGGSGELPPDQSLVAAHCPDCTKEPQP